MQEARQAALAALQKKVEQPAPAQFGLNFLWLDKNIAVAVDQLFDQVNVVLAEYIRHSQYLSILTSVVIIKVCMC